MTPMFKTQNMDIQILLSEAVSAGDIEKIKILIKKGADIHAEEDMVLDHALTMNQPQTFWFFLENFDFDLSQNWRVLRDAASYNYKDIIDYLISKQVDLNLKESIALKNCCLRDQKDMFSYLVHKGADRSLQGDIGYRIKGSFYVNLAWGQGSFNVLEFLLQNEEHKKDFFSQDSIDYHISKNQVLGHIREKPKELSALLLALRHYSEDNYQYMRKTHALLGTLAPEYLIFFEKLECEWVLRNSNTPHKPRAVKKI